MSDEIELASDGGGVAILGDSAAVDRFLLSAGLASRDLDLQRLRPGLNAAANAAQAASTLSSSSGRWVKLTKESAQAVKKYGLTPTDTPGVSHAMIGKSGSIKSWVQIASGPGARLTNPALLAGAAGIMAQVAMQQAMNEVMEYLATIDEKVDDVLRAQKDAVIARMIGVSLVLDEAMTLRDKRGRVDDITWSKVRGAPATVADTQAYALRQLGALAEKLERRGKLGDLADTTRGAATYIQEWLAVLARTFQLQDAIAVLELDRVLDAAPDELNGHRLGLQESRQRRIDLIAEQTEHLMSRIDRAAATANTKVLTNPTKAPAVVRSRNQVATVITGFHEALGLERAHEESEARRWSEAARTTGNKALAAGADRVDAARRVGGETADRAKSVSGKLTRRVAAHRRRGETDAPS